MRRLLCLLVVVAPALAIAQPAPPPNAPPPPPAGDPPPYTPATGTPPYGSPPPATGTPAGPYAPPPPSGQAPYGPGMNTQPYGQQPQPYMQPQPVNLRNGMTFEANLGIGWIRLATENDSDTSDLGIGGLCIGVGGWMSDKLAITARIAGVTYSENDGRFTSGLLGGVVQYWVDDHIWAGGGAGIGVIAVSSGGQSDSWTGVGLEGRVGYTFSTASENTFNVSFELTPGFFDIEGVSITSTGIALMVGYQHL